MHASYSLVSCIGLIYTIHSLIEVLGFLLFSSRFLTLLASHVQLAGEIVVLSSYKDIIIIMHATIVTIIGLVRMQLS